MTAEIGAKVITLNSSETVGWKVGDKIGISASSYNHENNEIRTISSISNGVIGFSDALLYRHYGSANGIVHGVDMRTEVVLLSRSILIKPADSGWGCQTLTTDLIVSGLTPLIGQTVFSYVEFAGCG